MASNLSRIEQLPAPTQPSDLEGWGREDFETWLPNAIRMLTEAEQRTEEVRHSVGLALWHVLKEFGEAAYGEVADQVARDAGVQVATLTRWRTAAEQHFQLAAPSKRTQAQRKREEKPLTRRTRKPSSAGRGDTQASEVQPTPEEGRRDSPRADGTASPRGAQPPDPSIPPREPAPEVGSFIARQPTTMEDYRLLFGLTATTSVDIAARCVERKTLMDINRLSVAAVSEIDGTTGKKPEPKKVEPPKKASSKASDISVSDCRHPVGSRIDDMCCQCGATVGKLKR